MAIAYEPGMSAADKRAANAAVNQARTTAAAAAAMAAGGNATALRRPRHTRCTLPLQAI